MRFLYARLRSDTENPCKNDKNSAFERVDYTPYYLICKGRDGFKENL